MTDYIFKEGNPELAPVLLLHSTGGDEAQLLPIAEELAPNHSVLSIRGRISENGVNRYFRLKGPGFTKDSFDLESLDKETAWLAEEIKRLATQHQLDADQFIVIGYSNGANVALYMRLAGIFDFAKIIAFHGMQLREIGAPVQNDRTKVFLSHADNDPIVPTASFEPLVEELEKAGCSLEIFKSTHGHQLTQEELMTAKNWLENA